MEAQEVNASGLALKGDEAPGSYYVAPRSEYNVICWPTVLAHTTEPAKAPEPEPALAQTPAPEPETVRAPAPSAPVSAAQPVSAKKKRGRPRKYGPDGSVALALSPMPISSCIPLTGEFSAWKRGRGRPMQPIKKTFKYDYETPGDKMAYSVGANFTPHVLTVNAGEDVTMKIMSFSQQGSLAVCILSATGTISNVTLRQPTASWGTLTYEGRFEILSLSGSFMPTENGLTKSRSGGMSVSLAGPDGRVVGGGLAGLFVAAGPVQVVVGSFLLSHQREQKPKKHRMETLSVITTPYVVSSISSEEAKGAFGGIKPIVTPTAFHFDNPVPFNNVQEFKTSSSVDTKTSLPEDESRDPSQSNCEVSY